MFLTVAVDDHLSELAIFCDICGSLPFKLN